MNIANADTTVYLFSTSELWLLLSQFAPVYVLGIENPYLGWLSEEIEVANRQAADSLLERGLARPATDETVDIGDDLLAMVETCARPVHSAILQVSTSDGQSSQTYFHFADHLIVEHQQTNLGSHTLQSFSTGKGLLEHIIGALRLNDAICESGRTFELSETALYEAVELAGKNNFLAATEKLRQAGLSEANTEALLAAVTTPTANASLAVIANQGDPDTQHVRGFGILQSAAHLWLMRPYDKLGQPQVEFLSVDAAEIRRRLEETLPITVSKEA